MKNVLKRKAIRRWLPTEFKQSKVLPLIMFGDGMKKKDSVCMKKVLSSTTSVLYSKLLERQKQIQCALVDINEYTTH